MFRCHLKSAALAICLCGSAQAVAGWYGYSDYSEFSNKISGYSQSVEDFEGVSAGTTIGNGGTVGGITYEYPDLAAENVSLKVTDGGGWDTTSGSNFLGTDDSDVFLDGDNLSLSFSATNAIGMYFLSVDELIDGDILLQVGQETIGLALADLVQTLSDGTSVYFLGLVNDSDTFDSVDILTGHDNASGYFAWNIDDIVTASNSSGGSATVRGVPEPGPIVLLSTGLLIGGAFSRKVGNRAGRSGTGNG